MKRIVVVDDNPQILAMMQVVLESEGYTVQAYTNGASLRAALQNPPDLIFLDVFLQGEDGPALCRQVKTDERTRQIPVILCSASSKAREMQVDSLADAFLEKPFHIRALLALVQQYAPLTPDMTQ